MIELALFLGLLCVALRSRKTLLTNKIHEFHSKVDPSIGEELGIESVKQIPEILKKIKYEPDIIDYVQTPRETLEKGYGDCEDFAVLTYSLLDYLGLNPRFAIAFNFDDPEAHAFVFYKCPYNCSTYYFFSNDDVFTAKSVEEAANMLGFTNVIYEKPPEGIIYEKILKKEVMV